MSDSLFGATFKLTRFSMVIWGLGSNLKTHAKRSIIVKTLQASKEGALPHGDGKNLLLRIAWSIGESNYSSR
ncbi:hypothetical protein EMIT0P253_10467 [Pseudomonas sp. IT-P253]